MVAVEWGSLALNFRSSTLKKNAELSHKQT